MSDEDFEPPNDLPQQRKRMLSRWENEGGAGPRGHGVELALSQDQAPMPDIGPAEMGALHIRVIALENLIIALLAKASDEQLEQARSMARYISPREGFTHHPLTIHAAKHMVDLVERSARFRSGELPKADDIE